MTRFGGFEVDSLWEDSFLYNDMGGMIWIPRKLRNKYIMKNELIMNYSFKV